MPSEQPELSEKAADSQVAEPKADLSRQVWDEIKNAVSVLGGADKADAKAGEANGFLTLTSPFSFEKQATPQDNQLQQSVASMVDASFVELGDSAGSRGSAGSSTDGAKYERVTVHKSDGILEAVSWTDSRGTTRVDVDVHGKMTGGRLIDEHGDEVASITVVGGNKLVYDDGQTKTLVETDFDPRKGMKVRDLGTYDPDTGMLSKAKDGYEERKSLAPGRTDIVAANGDIQTMTARGDYGLVVKATGDALVSHADKTGAHLHPDGTINLWGPKPGDNVNEKLSAAEQKYLKNHPDIDTRDVAEIHRRFHPHQDKIDAFYKSLEKLDSAKNLSAAEKESMRTDLMHHVAAPQEIYQGTTESCNVSVVERDLAMTNPAKYADIVRKAVSDGVVHTERGDIKVDPANLKMADSSGRDLASRVFQTAALHAEFWPTKDFVNTPDGVGRLKPGDRTHNKGSDQPVPFSGLLPAELADISYQLTGKANDKAVAFIKTGDELKSAVDKGGVPMTIGVDATASPVDASPPSDHRPNHVVTIVGVIDGQPRKYLIQNQWGLEKDLSTPDKAVDESALIKNMTGDGRVAGQALVPGDHTKIVANGKEVEDFNYLEEQRKKRYQLELTPSGH